MVRQCLSIMLIFALTPAVFSQTASMPIDNVPELKGLAQRWKEAAASLYLPGFAVAVIKDGKIVAIEGFGVRDVGHDKPVTPDTMFYIASATKPFVAMALCTLVDQGKVDLDAPVKSYLPRFQLADAALTSSVTVRDLLCHKHGINSFPIVFLDAYTGQINDDRYYDWLKEAELEREVSYTNVHFTLVGRIIEAVSGQTWQEFLKSRILDPAGLSRTTAYASRMYGDSNTAFPMEPTKNGLKRANVRKNDAVMHAAGGMGTTARDAANWLLLNMQNGSINGKTIVTAKSARQMQTFHSKLPSPRGSIRRLDGFGLGWFKGAYRGKEPYLQHGGGYIGTAAHMAFMPEQKIGIVFLGNASPPGQALSDVIAVDVFDRLLAEKDLPDLLPAYKKRMEDYLARNQQPESATEENPGSHDQRILNSYAGRYSNPRWGDAVVSADKGSIKITMGNLSQELVPGGTAKFVSSGSGDMFSSAEFRSNRGNIISVHLLLDGEYSAEFVRK